MFKLLTAWYLALTVCSPILGQQVLAAYKLDLEVEPSALTLAIAEFDPGVNPIEEQGHVDICVDSVYA